MKIKHATLVLTITLLSGSVASAEGFEAYGGKVINRESDASLFLVCTQYKSVSVETTRGLEERKVCKSVQWYFQMGPASDVFHPVNNHIFPIEEMTLGVSEDPKEKLGTSDYYKPKETFRHADWYLYGNNGGWSPIAISSLSLGIVGGISTGILFGRPSSGPRTGSDTAIAVTYSILGAVYLSPFLLDLVEYPARAIHNRRVLKRLKNEQKILLKAVRVSLSQNKDLSVSPSDFSNLLKIIKQMKPLPIDSVK
jgi:hypothetical protein